jgi:hypothetical protein
MGAVRKTKINSMGRAMSQVLEYSSPPLLEFVPHAQAHSDFAWKATRDILQRLGYAEASRLAGSVTGCIRERLDRLVIDKRALL